MWIQSVNFIHTSSTSCEPICVYVCHPVWIPVTFTTVKIKNLYHKSGYNKHAMTPTKPASRSISPNTVLSKLKKTCD